MSSALNTEQSAAFAAVKAGKNIFLTGAGGTGKTHTIRVITEWAAATGLQCAVTALTGCAALLLSTAHVKAKTLHSWAGIGLATEAPHVLVEAIRRNKAALRRWRDVHLLIIDEVSMMTPELLEKIDIVARHVRKRTDSPFGGVQLILAGDFCQLPPVTRGISDESTTRFAFESPVWATLIEETHELTQIVRQSDPVFQQILNEARLGDLSEESIRILKTRKGLPWQTEEIRPTLLYTLNAKIAEINAQNMGALTGERATFAAATVEREWVGRTRVGGVSPASPDVQRSLERLDKDAPYDTNLELCVGAQVMLISNVDQERGLVNGSRGVVTGYSPVGLPIVRFLTSPVPVVVDRVNWWLDDYESIGRAQIPLKVAYALTIHKSQGATLDSALISIGSSTFEYGQAYVALSRVKSLESLYLHSFNPSQICCHPAVRKFYETVRAAPVPATTTTTTTTSTSALWHTAGLSAPWTALVEPFLTGPTGRNLTEQITSRAAAAPIAPQPEDVFNALRACADPAAIRVIILGQDPYPTAGHAHGLAFSVRPSIAKLPPSLQNIYKELTSDIGLDAPPTTGCLQRWAEQGVLLLNDSLTVTVGAPLSHSGLGWEELTAQILSTVLTAVPHVVIVAWGRFAQKKLETSTMRPLTTRHTILSAPHPSPLSAHTGFFGSRPFSQANTALVAHGQAPINWAAL
jgi:ATP-dependent DNA helicase PIF1